jgi:cell wall-associated NlpC family hydrolase
LRHARRLLHVVTLAAVVAGFVMPVSAAAANPTAFPAPTAKPSLASLQQQIKEQSSALEKIVERYDKVNEDLATNVKAEAKLEAAMVPAKAALADSQRHIASIASNAYMNGQLNSLSALVSASDTADLLNELSTLDQVAASQQQQVGRFQAATVDYQNKKQALDDLIATQTAQRKELLGEKATITTKLASLYKLRAQAYGSATVASGGHHPAPPYLPGRGGKIVSFAYAQLGKPYSWAQAGPRSYDCSGLVLAAYRSIGISLPHNARMQWGQVSHITRSELSPGDLVFYESLGHVAIYIGGSRVIHAPSAGDVVKISSVDMMRPYGYGRV